MKRELELVDYPTAVLLKQNGFDWGTRHYWKDKIREGIVTEHEGIRSNYNLPQFSHLEADNTLMFERFSRPTYALVRQWLWDTHQIFISVTPFSVAGGIGWSFDIEEVNESGGLELVARSEHFTLSHDESLAAGIGYKLKRFLETDEKTQEHIQQDS